MQAIIDRPSSALELLSGSLASTSTYFICYLVIQGSISLPMGQLVRLVPTLSTAVKLHLKLVSVDKPADEPALYHVFWSAVSLAATIGISCALPAFECRDGPHWLLLARAS